MTVIRPELIEPPAQLLRPTDFPKAAWQQEKPTNIDLIRYITELENAIYAANIDKNAIRLFVDAVKNKQSVEALRRKFNELDKE